MVYVSVSDSELKGDAMKQIMRYLIT